MATIYDLTNATNSTGVMPILQGVNTASGGMAGAVLLWTMFIITFIGLKGWNNTDAFGVSTFVYATLAILFFFGGLIGETMLFIFLAMGATGLLMLLLK